MNGEPVRWDEQEEERRLDAEWGIACDEEEERQR